jgi:N-acetylmuramic acid 6-phosphate etherase
LVDLFLEEERHLRLALVKIRPDLVKAAHLVGRKMKQGGRLIYVGAGTSGRLGVLDASEMPPTFGVSPQLVQGIIAGGLSALVKSREGAEDDSDAGAVAIQNLHVSEKDVVLGIAASGRTPFVLGALKFAAKNRASTIFLTCNPKWEPEDWSPDVGLHVPTGPELISGSTRLKAGTATKIILNLLSSIAMIRLGKVYDNLMIDLQVTNEKLSARAVHLLRELHPCSPQEADSALRASHWNIRRALARLQRQASRKKRPA